MSDRRNTHTPRTFLRPLTGAVLGLLAAGSLGIAQAASTICEPDGGYVVAYYNGTFAMPEDADAQRAALRIARLGKYDKAAWGSDGVEKILTGSGKLEPVRYETFYSTAGTASGATESRFQAVAAEYRKLLDGALTQNWEYFWDMAAGSIDNWSVLAAKSGDARFLAITSAFPATVTGLATAAKTALQTELDSSNTTLAARQLARAQALYTERQKLLMVSYSQGTLFANKAFAKLGVTDSSVSRQELSVLPADAAKTALTTNMAALTVPTPASNQGFFTATLSWSAPAAAIGTNADGTAKQNDFDLHVIEPTPPAVSASYVQWVHFSTTGDPGKGGGGDISKQGYAGYLDKDSLGLTAVDMGPEHYYASCDESKLLPGTYWVSVTTVRSQLPAQTFATLQIATAKSGEVYSKTFNYSEIPGFIQQTKLTFPVKVVLTKNSDGTWAKPEVTPYSPSATYEFSGLPVYRL
ncbi:MAG: hypothetical protein RL260_2556 [Pseudomonadota bacterium]